MRRTILSTLGAGLAIAALFAVPLGAAHADDATPSGAVPSQGGDRRALPRARPAGQPTALPPLDRERCDIKDNGCYQHFQGGSIHWSPTTDAQPTWGMIRQRWAGLGWERGRLGYPTGPEYCGFRDNGCLQRFLGGIVYWSARTGAHPTWGAILARYGQLRGRTARWATRPQVSPASVRRHVGRPSSTARSPGRRAGARSRSTWSTP